MTSYPVWAWAFFVLFISLMLALDLGVFRKKSHTISLREALSWCAVWFTLALAFNGFVYWKSGPELGMQWLTSYIVEICLSVDNLFVFIMVFSYFKVTGEHQHRVLFWGILGAAIMRAVFILSGVQLVARFQWILVIFGAFLVFTGIKLALPKKEEDSFDPESNWVVKLLRKCYPIATQAPPGQFFVMENGRRAATPLLIVLAVIETTDLAFALDSIPAVLAITNNSFVAFTSNIFAILGLRSLYFALSGVMGLFRFLNIGLAAVLTFIGAKMLVGYFFHYHVSVGLSLAIIGSILALSIAASLLFPEKKEEVA